MAKIEPQASRRRLAAVLAADVAGYSKLMGEDEDGTIQSLKGHQDAIFPLISESDGTIVDLAGDGILAIFDSVVAAVRCAIAIQETVAARNRGIPGEKALRFRMGVHSGDVVYDGARVYGDDVNIAARLETSAEPGTISISSVVRDEINNKIDTSFTYKGNMIFKNINRPIRTYSIDPGRKSNIHCLYDSELSREKITLSIPDKPSIAIIPFQDTSIDPQQAYFADGVVDEIIHMLGSVSELFVIARASIIGFSRAPVDARSIGRELGVRYVLSGSIGWDDNRLRIITELSDTLSGQIIRTDRYDSQFENLFELQGRISVQVLRSIAPRVRERELKRAQRKPPENLTAYDRLLQAQALSDRMEFAEHIRAEELLREAIQIDQYYAAAYTALAHLYVFRIGEGWSRDVEADAAEAANAAQTAMDLDGNDPMAVAIFGYVLSYMRREHDRGLMFIEQALNIGPNAAGALALGSAAASFIGDGALAVQRAELALRLSPLDAHVFWYEGVLAQAHYVDGNFDEALKWAVRSSHHSRSGFFNMRTRTATLVALGKLEEAADVARQIMRASPAFSLLSYRKRCPFVPAVLEPWIERLRRAGLPDEAPQT
ncbi:adenylate/guanylate cyclase domain-containing protein [Bosea sp. BIWAKO-01]|uniref:adenylate/guanylate cyclase domain-containing protein n=1 Tax=Bosea sp. BIWAKO-01 TaxID=506668 RepID=UPI00159F1574|nr:adenylate/guanylate cyclase domain-containing protein [Bosea sp. BIWAKO-01]